MRPGWYRWVLGDDERGILHYFEVWAGNPEYDDDEVYHPVCGSYPRAESVWLVDDSPPFRNNQRCKRCQKKAPWEALA